MAGSKDKKLKLYGGSFSGICNDLDKATVMADIKQWMAERIAV